MSSVLSFSSHIQEDLIFIRFSDFQELVGHEDSLGARAHSLI